HLLADIAVEEVGARDPGPGMTLPERKSGHDLFTPGTRQAARERVLDESIRPLAFPRTIHRGPERGVGDVSDDRLRSAHAMTPPGEQPVGTMPRPPPPYGCGRS